MTVQLPPVDPALVDAASALDIDAATARHKELAAAVDRANVLYHSEDAPELSDAEYDQLFRELVVYLVLVVFPLSYVVLVPLLHQA